MCLLAQYNKPASSVLKMFGDASAYDDRQKAKRESIISHPLFSSPDKSLSTTPAASAAASSSSSSSSSSVTSKSVAVQQQKLAVLSRVRHISASGHRTNLFSANSPSPRTPKVQNSKGVLGVRRRSSGDRAEGLEPPNTKRRQLSDTSTSDQQQPSASSVDVESHSASTEPSGENVGVVSDSQRLEPEKCETCETTANALSLVSNYSSSVSSNDSDS